jgi:phosphatidyl-myo-inositol dimannoside synthase
LVLKIIRYLKRDYYMKAMFLTRAMPPPFMGGAGTYYYNIFKRFPIDEMIIFTEKSRVKNHSNHDNRMRFIRRGYIKAKVPQTGVRRQLKKIPGYMKLSIFVMMLLWSVELIFISITKRPDVIYIGQLLPTGFLGISVCKLFKIPYVVFVHGEELAKSFGTKRLKTYRRIFDNAGKIICNSSFTKNLIIKSGIDEKNIEIVNPMVDCDTFHPNHDTNDIKKKLSIKNEKVILSVGRLSKRKGHAKLIKNLKSIESNVGRITYVVVGTDLGERDKLKKIAEEIGVNDKIKFVGRVPSKELPKYYCLCDVMVLPNYERENHDNEGFGMVFLEANACGKPVVGGLSGGTIDAVIHNETGVLINVKNDWELVEAVTGILTNEEYARKMGENGRRRAIKEFNWYSATEKVRAIGLTIKKNGNRDLFGRSNL